MIDANVCVDGRACNKNLAQKSKKAAKNSGFRKALKVDYFLTMPHL